MLWARCLKLLAALCALCAGFFLLVVFLFSETWVLPSRNLRPDGAEINSSIVLQLELCPEQPEGLVGPLHIEFSEEVTIDQVSSGNPMIKLGGRYCPSDCVARQKIAIVIPFRNREKHLVYWLYYLHPILRRQQGDYAIYVVHQAGNGTFNRAKLLNVGAIEALKDRDYDCLVFSDVDIIPMDDRNLYHCGQQPRHLACAMDKFGFRLPYHGYFGGVIGLTRQQFHTINGFSNRYWGWGTEDDDMYKRITLKGMKVERPPAIIARTKMIHHRRDKGNGVNTKNYDLFARTSVDMMRDGLNSLQYNLLSISRFKLYTELHVDVGKPKR